MMEKEKKKIKSNKENIIFDNYIINNMCWSFWI